VPRQISDQTFAAAIGQALAEITKCLRGEIAALAKRVAKLESTPQLKYVGTGRKVGPIGPRKS
jgi:hypothetical protein